MLPTSIAGSIRITPPLTVSPAHHGADVDALVREVAAGLDARAGARRARWRRRHSRRRRRRRRAGSASARPPGRCSRAARASPPSRRGGRGGSRVPSAVPQLDLVDAMVAADDHELHRVAVDDHRERLQERARGHAELAWRRRRSSSGRASARPRERRAAGRASTGCGICARHLEVGGIAGGEHDLVLARRARRHVLVGSRARPSSRRRPRPGTTRGRSGRSSGRRRRTCFW